MSCNSTTPAAAHVSFDTVRCRTFCPLLHSLRCACFVILLSMDMLLKMHLCSCSRSCCGFLSSRLSSRCSDSCISLGLRLHLSLSVRLSCLCRELSCLSCLSILSLCLSPGSCCCPLSLTRPVRRKISIKCMGRSPQQAQPEALMLYGNMAALSTCCSCYSTYSKALPMTSAYCSVEVCLLLLWHTHGRSCQGCMPVCYLRLKGSTGIVPRWYRVCNMTFWSILQQLV